jgi:hypothetical protein
MNTNRNAICLVILGLLLVTLGGTLVFTLIKISDLNERITELNDQFPGDSPLAEEGMIFIRGTGYFYYQEVDIPLTGTVFQGVTFTPNSPGEGTTITAPLAYWLTVRFVDGTTEELQYVGFYSDLAVNINFTQHESPKAGIMLVYDSTNRASMYLLVSERN